VGGRGLSCAVRRRDAVMACVAKEGRRLGFGRRRRDAVMACVVKEGRRLGFGRRRRLGLEEHRLPEEAGNR
jgi:hypothetical protein